MPINIAIYEDEHNNLLSPLSLTRPVYELRCGMSSLHEKIQRNFDNDQMQFLCRNYLVNAFQEELESAGATHRINSIDPAVYLLLNGRYIFNADDIEKLHAHSENNIKWSQNETVIAARLNGSRLSAILEKHEGIIPSAALEDLPESPQKLSGKLITYPWDLVHANAGQIEADFNYVDRGGENGGKIYPNVTLMNEENIYIAPGAVVKPGAVLDAESGPIYIDKNALIMANSTIEGPVFIGEGSTIKIGAKIYEGTSIGKVCKVGGEVEESIIHSYSNKQHDGFLGHAYLGQWVNIGAGSNNSDLKNNYSNIKMFVNGEWINSGSKFVGLTMGDHSKCAINTMFNTGTIVGVMCNVFGAGFPPKYLPSYSWGGAEDIITYRIEKALEVAQRVMNRRKKELTPAQEELLIYIYKMT